MGTAPPPPPFKPRHRNDWNEIRRRHPERMARHIESLNIRHREMALNREKRLAALIPVLPDAPMASWTLRDELAQAWEDVYGEPMDGKKAWLEVRFGIRRALFILLPDGKYVKMVKHGDQSRPPEGVA